MKKHLSITIDNVRIEWNSCGRVPWLFQVFPYFIPNNRYSAERIKVEKHMIPEQSLY